MNKLELLTPWAEVAAACLLLWAGLYLVLAWCVATVLFGAVVVVAERSLPSLSGLGSVVKS